MVDHSGRTLDDLVRHVGQYPEEAFLFVREGLSFACTRVHGEESDAHRALQHYLAENDLDWSELIERYQAGDLPPFVREAITQAGGCERLNRHVGGRELCWALRDYALYRWGILARVVLESWNVRSTMDFGRIVFGFIDFDMMRRESNDTLADFDGVFAFGEAFDDSLSITMDDLRPNRREV